MTTASAPRTGLVQPVSTAPRLGLLAVELASSRLATVLVFALLIVNLMAVWWVGNGVPLFQDVGETSSAFLDGLNRTQFGFDNAGLLHDEATGPDPAAHPYLYSHNPNFSRFVSYAFTRIGVDSLPPQHLFSMAVSVAGLVFAYFFVKRLMGRTPALISILLAGTHYLGILQWAPNLLRSFNILTFFGAFYYAARWRQDRTAWCLIPLALFIFFIGLSDISFAAVYVAALFFFLILCERKPGRIFAAVLVTAGPVILAFGLYLGLLVRELGWEALQADLRYTYAVRNLTDQGPVFVEEFFAAFRASDIPFLEQARRFFTDHHVTFWVLSNGSQGVLRDFFNVLYIYGLAANGPLWFASVAVWAVTLLVSLGLWFRRPVGWQPDVVALAASLTVLAITRLTLGLNGDSFALLLWGLVVVASGRLLARRIAAIVSRTAARAESSGLAESLVAKLSTRRAQRGLGVAGGGVATALVLLFLVGFEPLRSGLQSVGVPGADRVEVKAIVAVILVTLTWIIVEWTLPRLRPKIGSLEKTESIALELLTSSIRWAPDPAGSLSYVAAFTLGLVAGLTVLGGYLTTFTMVPYRTLLVFLDMVLLSLLATTFLRMATRGAGLLRVFPVGGLALGALLWATTQIGNTRTVPALELAAGPVLAQQYRGKTFASNVYPSVLSYYTRQWALWVSVPRPNYLFLPENIHDAIFPFQADYWDNPAKYEEPEYYLCDSSSPRANAPGAPEAAPDYCSKIAQQMAAHGHVPEVVADYFAVVRLTYSAAPTYALGSSNLPVFGSSIQLVGSWLEPATARAGESVILRLRWHSLAQMSIAYKAYVHVLDPRDQQRIIAQRDAEPQSGRAATTSWIPGQTLDDAYTIALPEGLAAGQYPLEIGFYDPSSNERLILANGDNHLALGQTLRVY